MMRGKREEDLRKKNDEMMLLIFTDWNKQGKLDSFLHSDESEHRGLITGGKGGRQWVWL